MTIDSKTEYCRNLKIETSMRLLIKFGGENIALKALEPVESAETSAEGEREREKSELNKSEKKKRNLEFCQFDCKYKFFDRKQNQVLTGLKNEKHDERSTEVK